MSIVGIIPAKANSRELPNKNILDFCGKTLIGRAIECSLEAGLDRTVVITDSLLYREIARKEGAECVDKPSMEEMPGNHVIYAILQLLDLFNKDDIIVELQPTTPLRTPNHVREALKLYGASGGRNVISVTRAKDPNHVRTIEQGELRPISARNPNVTRQEIPPYYKVNGAIYISTALDLSRERTYHTKNAVPFFMPSYLSIDIDTWQDYQMAKAAQFLFGEGRD